MECPRCGRQALAGERICPCGAPLAAGAGDSTAGLLTEIEPAEGKATVLSVAPRNESSARGDPAPRAIGDYEILSELGRGGMGVVFRARQAKLGREVALKVLSGPGLSDTARVRFEREARSASRLHHPGIVPIHELGIGADLCFYSMELVEGESLAARLKARAAPLEPREAASLLRALAEATHYAHLNGIVHRDLKPANVLLRSDGSPAIADFGLARSIEEKGLTTPGDVLGTPVYMAPEQAAGREIGPATDIYALGAILYECLSQKAPFDGESVAAVLVKVELLEPAPLARLRPGLPRDLVTICEKAMRKRPSERYPDAATLAEDLARFLEGEPVRARPIGTVERIWRYARRHRGATGAAGTILVLAGLGTWAALDAWRARRESELERERGLLEERTRWVEADRLVEAAQARIDAGLAWRRAGRLEELPRQAPAIEEWLARAFVVYPDFPPALVVQARLARLLGDDDRALALLDLAIEREPGLGIAHYERGLVRAERYRRELERRMDEDRRRRLGLSRHSSAGWSRVSRAETLGRVLAAEDEELARLAAAAADDFARVGRLAIYPDREACGRGLLAFHSNDLERAERELQAAVEANPALAEAWLALGRVAIWQKDDPGAAGRFRRAIEADPGWWVARWELAHCLLDIAAAARAEESDDLYAEAAREMEEAARLQTAMPLMPPAQIGLVWRGRVVVSLERATQAEREGRDALAALAGGPEAAERYCALLPADPWSHFYRGEMLLSLAHHRWWAGQESRDLLEEAQSEFGRALAADEGSPDFLAGYAEALCHRADVLAAAGEPASELLRDALSALERAIAALPGEGGYRLSRVTVLLWLSREDPDPEALWARAEEDLAEAARLDPSSTALIVQRGALLVEKAERTRERGGDARELFARALAELDRALAEGMALPLVRQRRARAALTFAQEKMARGEDPRPLLGEARRDFEALAVDLPDYPEAHSDLAVACRVLGGVLWREGPQEAGRSFARALAAMDRAIELRDCVEFREFRIGVLRSIGGLTARGEARIDAYRRAVADCDHVLASAEGGDPAFLARWRRISAEHRCELAFVMSFEGQNAVEAYEEGFAEYERALEISPGDADLRRVYSGHLYNGTLHGPAPGERREAWALRALAVLEPAIELAPDDLALRETRANLHFQVAESARGRDDASASLHYRDAAGDYTLVLDANPARPDLVLWRGVARRLLGCCEERLGRDPRESTRAAAADLEEVLESPRASSYASFARTQLGLARLSLAFYASARGENGEALATAAASDLDAVLAGDPASAQAIEGLALARVWQGEYALAAAAYKKLAEASSAKASWARKLARDLELRPDQERLRGDAWGASILNAHVFAERGCYGEAIRRYEEGLVAWSSLPEARREELLADPLVTNHLAQAHAGLAVLFAQGSGGTDGPGLPLRELAPGERERLVESSLEHLRAAVRLEPVERAVLSADEGLAPLRDEAGFGAFLESLGGE
ncbi:MAG: protein kinase [Planctomycetes bacterium]|nr:protein kinase [Planctomycetota bacterium]